jgi:hypothetical protein
VPFVKYETEETARPALKINGSTIVINEGAWSSAGLGGAEFVNLWWDDRSHRVGITSTESNDRNRFAVRKSSRGVSIPAKKFFAKFGISDPTPAGGLTESDEVVAFRVNTPSSASAFSQTGDAPRRRGRRPKNAA